MNTADYAKKFRALQSERSFFDKEFDDAAHYFYPSAPSFYFSDQPKQNRKDVYDSTGRLAAIIYANMLFGYLTNPAVKWLELKFVDTKLNRENSSVGWLKKLETEIFSALMLSTFYEAVGEFYIDYIVFGTGVMFAEEDDTVGLRFYSVPLAECYVAENSKNTIDRVYRKISVTGLQLKEMFPDGLSKETMEKIERGPLDKFTVVHVVEPRETFDPSKQDVLNMPFKSLWFEMQPHGGKMTLIKESGYKRFPFLVARYTKLNSTPYGNSPCREELPNMKSLNELVKSYVITSAREADPPIDVPSKGYYSVLNKTPGAINYRRPNLGKEEAIRRLLPEPSFSPALQAIDGLRNQIKRALFNDLFFILTELPRMTATEVVERAQEKLVLLGPVIGRLKTELFDPLVGYMTERMIELGRIEPPPETIQSADYEVRLTSLLSKAQRFSELRNLQNFLATINTAAQYNPSALDVIDFDNFVRHVADITGLPEDVVRAQDDVETIRQSRLALQLAAGQQEQGRVQ